MKPSIRALYLQGGRVGGVEIEGQVWQLDGVAFRWSCRAPDELGGLDVYDLIVIDGEGLSGGVVPLVQRLRWQEYRGFILVVRFGRSELERVLTCEAGANEIRREGLSPALIEQIGAEQWRDAIEGGRTQGMQPDSGELSSFSHLVGHRMPVDAPPTWLGLNDRNRSVILR